MLGRLVFRDDAERARAERWDITDLSKIYTTDDLAKGDNVMFAATGVTDGAMLRGVRRFKDGAKTSSMVMRSKSEPSVTLRPLMILAVRTGFPGRMSVSLQHAQWVLPEPDLNTVEHLMRSADLPELVARLLVQRGIVAQGVQRFLQPTLRDDFPDPLTMAGMELCAHDVAHAIMDEQNFAIFGDFDVDGATSSAVAHRFLNACGVDAPITIPERLTDGYGPNARICCAAFGMQARMCC